MHQVSLLRLASAFLIIATASGDETKDKSSLHCRCAPSDSCWPSEERWNNFNNSVGGRLVKSEPVAVSCYPGELQNADRCSYVKSMWKDETFQTQLPVSRWYPFNQTCPPIEPEVQHPGSSCTLGQLPEYAVQVTERQDIKKALLFANETNIRVSVATTGHDLNGRADGYGSLAIWLRHFEERIELQDEFVSNCPNSTWTGKAMHISGGWQWRDVHKVAKEKSVIIVSGGSSSPGANGGWLSGGGHGPASRNYGLGADQLLEAEVMLWNGTEVIANHCTNTDLFRALRGGGPGYGVVLSTKVKAYDNVDKVTFHGLVMSPTGMPAGGEDLLSAVTELVQSYPDLSKAGFAGYALWSISETAAWYSHSFWTIGKNQAEAHLAFEPVRQSLAKFQGNLTIQEDMREYPDYWSFYEGQLDKPDKPGGTLLLTSRMLERESVANSTRVRQMVETVTGKPEEDTLNLMMLVSAGPSSNATDHLSGLHPAWRKSPMVLITGRRVSYGASANERQVVVDDVMAKGAAAEELAPDTGAYMNEGNRYDPNYKKNFYGDNYEKHLEAKEKYDPNNVFYCPTCVGAEKFVDVPDEALCFRKEASL